MKKLLLSTLMVLGTYAYTHAQNLWQDPGPVGIGTKTPTAALDIVDGTIKLRNSRALGMLIDVTTPESWAREYGISFGNQGRLASFGAYGRKDTLNYVYIGGGSLTDSNSYSRPWMVFRPNGNIGIGAGNTNPAATLSLNGSFSIWSTVGAGAARPVVTAGTAAGEIRGMAPNWNGGDDGFLRISAGGGTNPNTKAYIDMTGYSPLPDMNQNMVLGVGGTEKVRVLRNGNVGIGTSNPTAKLSVLGDIKAQRIKVTTTDWPDYVFGSNYQLPDLLQVAAFIEKNKHLPEVPSAAQVEKDGEIELGDMNKVLLKKVEELTLYIIELKKENIAMKERLDRNGIQ